ncbi:MAG: T9SS type A sorting domain-containing protein [Bacteroidota bacterium]|nr:T9SS type A sorting domain-containing protein [Bacteroidota bacterium]
MKKIKLTVFSILLTLGMANAQQQIANGGFELWDTIANYSQPENWYTLNPLSVFGFEPSTTITTDAQSGNYAVVLESKGNTFTDYTGLLCSGPILDANNDPDFEHMNIKFNGRPTHARFYYKSLPELNDTCVFIMVLLKWNAVLGKNDTLAQASFSMGDSVGSYTLANVPFEYYSMATPDSAYYIFSSSIDGFNPVVGSKFIVDDFELVYSPSGIVNFDKKLEASVYPNPSYNVLNIDFENEKMRNIDIYNSQGKLLFSKQLFYAHNLVELDTFETGIYFISIRGENNEEKQVKLIIQN